MSCETIGYLVEPSDMDKLRLINKRLFGDGTPLTPDERRDLANWMCVILDRLSPVYDTDIGCANPSH